MKESTRVIRLKKILNKLGIKTAYVHWFEEIQIAFDIQDIYIANSTHAQRQKMAKREEDEDIDHGSDGDPNSSKHS